MMVWANKKGRGMVFIGALLLLAAAGSVSSKLLVAPPTALRDRTDRDPQPAIVKSAPAGIEAQKRSNLLGGKDMAGQTPAADLPPLQNRIIKTGSVTLKVKKGRFNNAYEQVILLAQASGGYVAGSSSAAQDDRLTSGTLTIRIPSKNFELVAAKLRRLGRLTAMDISSQDVSTEFVDLESRLRHWRAQETILLSLMTKADTIADSITIQQQLSQVQLEIEQIAGRLNYLKDQTTFSSIQVTITEPGVLFDQGDRWGFKAAVVQAAHAFVDTVNGLIVLTGYLSPLLLAGGLAGLVWLGLRRRIAAAA